MPRLNPETKNKVFTLLSQAKSLNFIRRETGVKKTTAYYYMRKMHGRKIALVNMNTTNISRNAEILGFFAGDGNYYFDAKNYSYRIILSFNSLTEKRLQEYYTHSLYLLTHKKAWIYTTKDHELRVEMKSKELYTFLQKYLYWDKRTTKTKSVHIKDISLLNNEVFCQGFLRGLIDSDGCISKDLRDISFGSVSFHLVQDFLVCLDTLSISHSDIRVKKDNTGKEADFFLSRLYRQDTKRFLNLVQPAKMKRVGGDLNSG